MKNSLPAIGVTLGLTAVYCLIENYRNKIMINGRDGKGGQILSMKSRYGENDMKYNREF